MFPEKLLQNLLRQASALLDACKIQGVMLATAESCTGGLITALLTEIPGSSAVVDRGFVTYSNEAKVKMLGVPATLIRRHGAVSQEVAKAMALGALKNSDADISISVTGIAGPGGGTPEKPVGLVYMAVAQGDKCVLLVECNFKGNRSQIRRRAVDQAIYILMEHLSHSS